MKNGETLHKSTFPQFIEMTTLRFYVQGKMSQNEVGPYEGGKNLQGKISIAFSLHECLKLITLK